MDVRRTPVTGEDYSEWVESHLRGANPETLEWNRRFLEVLPHPDSMPVIQDVVVDDRGFVWVQEWQKPNGLSRRWRIVNPTTQQQVAIVVMPVDWKLLDIRDSQVLARGVTSLDEEFVAVFALSRPAQPETVVPPVCRVAAADSP